MSFSVLYVTHDPMQSLILGSSDWAMFPDPDLKSVRQYTSKEELSTVNWVLLIAGQFNDKMLFDGVGNADDVLVDVEVGLVEAVDAAEVIVAALVTVPPALLLGLVVPLALLPLLVPFLPTRAPTTPPTTAPMMTSRTTDPMISAFRFGTPHQRLGWSAASGCCSRCGAVFSGLT